MINQMLLEQLQRNLHSYIRSVRDLSHAQFLTKMNGWSPRDVTAHLIGWNRASIQSLDAVRRGELPDALVDPGKDFSRVNAAFVTQYSATDTQQLLRELEVSFQELARHAYTLPLADWTTDFGVRFDGGAVTIDRWLHDSIEDYAAHGREIEAWHAASVAAAEA